VTNPLLDSIPDFLRSGPDRDLVSMADATVCGAESQAGDRAGSRPNAGPLRGVAAGNLLLGALS
jgi:hypothetical protein